MDTSKQAYDEAQELYVKAYNDLAAARKAVAAAEQAFYIATEQLAAQEAKPGIPAYTQS